MRPRGIWFLLIGLFLALGGRAAAAAPALPAWRGKAAVLMDASSGQVLYQFGGNVRIYPASTTKLLTALLAAESGRLGEAVMASPRAFGVEGTSCYLQVGEQQTLEDLSACLMVASGNDAAIAIAEHLAGSVRAFAAQMTRRALAAGATQSNFTNPHGLHDPQHYTTALDLAAIGRAALTNPDVFRWGSMQKAYLRGPEKLREFPTKNVLIMDIPGSSGKIGFTEQAGHTIVQMAEREGKRLVAVLAGYDHQGWMFQHTEDLLNWGFAHFESQPLVAAGQVLQGVPVAGGAAPLVEVAAGATASILVPAAGEGPSPPVRQDLKLPDRVNAPVAAGQVLGELVVSQGGTVLARVPLVAAAAVPARSLIQTVVTAGARAGTHALLVGSSLLVLTFSIRGFNLYRRSRRRRSLLPPRIRPTMRRPGR